MPARELIQMRMLTEAMQSLDTGLPLREVLRELVGHACEITGARYGALGVLDSEKTALADFITIGLSAEEVARIGHLPVGHSLLGALIRDGKTVRLDDITTDPRFTGFPPGHPVMKSFLGVPLKVGSEIYGSLYLTDKYGGTPFGDDDQHLMECLSVGASLVLGYGKQAEQAELDRQRLKTVFDSAPLTLLFFGPPDGRLVLANPAAERLLERKLLAVPFEDRPRVWGIRHADGRMFAPQELPSYRAFHGETVVDLEAVFALPSGRNLPVLIDAAQVRSESGAVLGAVDIIRDASTAQELERVREEFAAVVAHDLRNPLQAILMQIDLQRENATGDTAPVPITVLDRIRHSVLRLAEMSNDILDASRIELGRLELERGPVQVEVVAEDVRRSLRELLATHPVEQTSVAPPSVVLADPRRLEQILTNLLDNAAKYSAPSAPIQIRIAPEDGGVTCSIEDHGVGLAPEQRAMLFDRFYQARRARQNKTGLGLGLYITRGLAEAHGGRLWYESELGRGTTFHVWLPSP